MICSAVCIDASIKAKTSARGECPLTQKAFRKVNRDVLPIGEGIAGEDCGRYLIGASRRFRGLDEVAILADTSTSKLHKRSLWHPA